VNNTKASTVKNVRGGPSPSQRQSFHGKSPRKFLLPRRQQSERRDIPETPQSQLGGSSPLVKAESQSVQAPDSPQNSIDPSETEHSDDQSLATFSPGCQVRKQSFLAHFSSPNLFYSL
jgi:hypothetical protein